jgi:multicomponent Na+:H+ antiporter subunit F
LNEWLIAACALFALLLPCVAVCALGRPIDGLVALELSGVIATTIMMLLAEGFQRQPFIDLAIVIAILSFAGSLAFARVLERDV